MLDILLLPYYTFKWAFSIAFWYYGLVMITNSEMYENASDNLKDKWNAYRKK